MAQTQADKLLNRITALHRSLRLEDADDTPSALERDLMLGYLRDLYAIYSDLDLEDRKPQAATAPTMAPPDPPREVPKPPTVPEPTPPQPTSPEPRPEVPAPKPEPSTPPPAPESPTPARGPEVPNAPVPPPPAPPVAEHTAKIDPEYQDQPAPNPPQPASEPNMSPDVEALFEDPEGISGVNNMLVRQRVTDLNRALSINNRVLFANKLFNGNDELNEALKSLNLKGSMANAKPMLADLAQQHRWTKEDREETAREFIDLVRRRYA